MNIINSIPARARQSVSQQRKELWSWNKNQNVPLEQMKAATMVLNMLDYAIVYIPSFFKDNLTCMIVTFIYTQTKKRISVAVIVMELEQRPKCSS